jgi:hypothetical protein
MNRRHGCERGNSDSADTGHQVCFFLFFRPNLTNDFRKTELQNKIVHLTSRQNCVAAFAQSCGDGLAASSTASCALSNTASPTARSKRRPSGQEKTSCISIVHPRTTGVQEKSREIAGRSTHSPEAPQRYSGTSEKTRRCWGGPLWGRVPHDSRSIPVDVHVAAVDVDILEYL